MPDTTVTSMENSDSVSDTKLKIAPKNELTSERKSTVKLSALAPEKNGCTTAAKSSYL